MSKNKEMLRETMDFLVVVEGSFSCSVSNVCHSHSTIVSRPVCASLGAHTAS